MTIVDIARLFLYLREIRGLANRGLRVEAVQHWAGGTYGDSWCVEMLWVWFDLMTQGNVPFPRGLTAEELRVLLSARQWRVDSPIPGDICLSLTPTGEAHHAALVTVSVPLQAIAGNTSDDGISSNGDRVAEHPIALAGKMFFRVPLIPPS